MVRSGRAGAERADVPRRMGAARLRAHAGDGDAGRLEHRHVALRPRRTAAATTISSKSYYQIWFAGLETADAGARTGRADEIEAGTAAASGQAGREARCRADGVRPCCTGAGRPSARPGSRRVRRRRPRPHQERSIRRRIRGCRAMCAAMSAPSRGCMASTCFRTPTALGQGRIRNGSTPWPSTAANCGAPDGDASVRMSVDAWESYLERA